jgi:hypothetical protein
MTPETLQRAKEIEKELKTLNEILDEVNLGSKATHWPFYEIAKNKSLQSKMEDMLLQTKAELESEMAAL